MRKVPEKMMEELLDAWMGMAMGIRGNRILKNLSFNEMVVCRILYQAERENREVTATDICARSRLLKSQVNKLLNDMENNCIIERHRDQNDKRRILITLSEKNRGVYLEEHDHVMEILKKISRQFDREETEFLIEKMRKVVTLMDELSE